MKSLIPKSASFTTQVFAGKFYPVVVVNKLSVAKYLKAVLFIKVFPSNIIFRRRIDMDVDLQRELRSRGIYHP